MCPQTIKSTTKKQKSAKRSFRAKPGSKGKGDFYRIEIEPASEFVLFRNQDVGKRGGLERLAGRKSNGEWETVAWLVEKSQAHREGSRLIPDAADARNLFRKLRSEPVWIKGDIFRIN